MTISDKPATPTSAPSFIPSETNTTEVRILMPEVTGGVIETLSYHLQRTEHGGSIFFDVIGGNHNQTLDT